MSASPTNGWLALGGLLSLVAAVAHLACIVGGPRWYLFFGAGERIASAVAAGDVWPHLLTAGIAAILGGFGYWALAGAGLVPRPPLLFAGLIVVTAIYLARGAVLFAPGLLARPDLSPSFLRWSSAIVLGYGLVHLAGVWRGWAAIKGVS